MTARGGVWSFLLGDGSATPDRKASVWIGLATVGAALCLACLTLSVLPTVGPAASEVYAHLSTAAGILTITSALAAIFAVLGDLRRAWQGLEALHRCVAVDEDGVQAFFDRTAKIERLIGERSASMQAVSDELLREHPIRLAAAGESAAAALRAEADAVLERLRESVRGSFDVLGSQSAKFAELIAAESGKVSDVMSMYADSMAARFNLAGVALARDLRDQAEAMRGRIEEAGDSAASTIARQGDEAAERLTNTCGSLTLAIDERAQALVARIETAGANVGQSLAREGDAAASRFASQGDALAARVADTLHAQIERAHAARESLFALLGEDAGDFATRAGDAADRLKSTLLDSSRDFDAVAAAGLQRFSEGVQARLEATQSGFATAESALVERLDAGRATLRREFDGALGDLVAAIGASAAETVGAISSQLEQAKSLFAERAREPLVEWLQQAQAAADQLAAKADAATHAVSSGALALTERISESLASFDATLGVRAHALGARIDAGAADLHGHMNAFETLLSDRGERLVGQFGEHAKGIDGALLAHIDEVQRRWTVLTAAFEVALASHGQYWEGRARLQTDSLATLADRHRADVDGALSRHAEFLGRALETGLEALQRTAAEREDDALLRLEAGARSMIEAVVARSSAFEETLFSRGRALQETLLAQEARLVGALEQGAVATEARAKARLDATAESLENLADRIDRRWEMARAAFGETISSAAGRLESELAAHGRALVGALGEGSERLRGDVVEPLLGNLQRITSEAAELAAATRNHSQAVETAAAAHRQMLQHTYDRAADAITSTIDSRAEALRLGFEAALSEADKAFWSRGGEIVRHIAANIADLRNLLERDGQEFLGGLDERVEKVSEQVQAASRRSLQDFERKASGLIATLSRRGDDLLAAMNAGASEQTRRIASLSGALDGEAEKATASLRDVERMVATLTGMSAKRGDALLADADPGAMRRSLAPTVAGERRGEGSIAATPGNGTPRFVS